MMKTIIDSFCVKSGIMCRQCEEKIRKGQITKLDLQVIKTLSEFENKYPVLKDIFFHKAKETGETLAILVNKKDMSKILSYGGKIIRELGERTGKKIKILGYGSDPR